jgi:hypothetical protein
MYFLCKKILTRCTLLPLPDPRVSPEVLQMHAEKLGLMMALRDGTFAPFQAVVCCVYDLICDRVKTINLTGPLNILL